MTDSTTLAGEKEIQRILAIRDWNDKFRHGTRLTDKRLQQLQEVMKPFGGDRIPVSFFAQKRHSNFAQYPVFLALKEGLLVHDGEWLLRRGAKPPQSSTPVQACRLNLKPAPSHAPDDPLLGRIALVAELTRLSSEEGASLLFWRFSEHKAISRLCSAAQNVVT
jgi:hypothetical protein